MAKDFNFLPKWLISPNLVTLLGINVGRAFVNKKNNEVRFVRCDDKTFFNKGTMAKQS